MTMSRQPDRKYSPRLHALVFALAAALPIVGAVGPVAAQSGAYELVVEPEAPRAQQAVFATVAVPFCRALAEVSHVEGTIEIGVRSALCFPRPGFRPMSVSLGKLPQGSYRLRVVNAEDPARPGLTPERMLTVAPPVPGDFADEFEPLLDYSGWWTTADSDRGEGWLVEHKVPDRMMFSWVAYDADGNPTWLVMQATERSYRALIGPVYRSERQGDIVVRTLIGEGRFEGTAADAATFVLTLEDSVEEPVSTSLRRLAF
jgi:hypothetical protein